MKSESISNALNLLDEDMIRHTEAVRERGSQRRKNNWRKWALTAACLCLIVVSGIVFGGVLWEQPGGEVSVLEKGVVSWQGMMPVEPETTVSIASLLVYSDSGMIVEQAQQIAFVPIGQYKGIYEKKASVESGILAESIGADISGAQDWYLVLGHTDMQYLIGCQGQEYSLWKFLCFDSEEYPYNDVLTLVYQIDSADQIAEIRVEPARMDNTDAGRHIQEEVGSHSITDRSNIAAIYQILSAMICYGENQWDRIDYGAVDADTESKSTSHEAVRLGRYLNFVTDYGNEIDELKYTAVSHMFYEFSGIAYQRLTENEAAAVEGILGIVSEDRTESHIP
ncbi:MAG: hypothetical protein K2N01_13050 [Lachnospiraceae bacterium]|nr:hypothetical protein [Lachnospiraceae bacterium]